MSATGTSVDAGEVATIGQISKRQLWVILSALLLGFFLAALDQTIVSTALPTIVADLHGASHLTWVVTAYLLASTASTPLWGKLGDQYGRKQFFQTSIVIFLVGSALSGLSTSIVELIAFRALQGLGGGGLIVGAQAIIGDVVPMRQRGRYQGLFGAVFGVASVVGPLLGGVFVDNLSWRWIFYINLPIGVIALTAIAARVPGRLTRIPHTIDYYGTAFIALAATSLVLFTSLGGTTYSWGSLPEVLLAVLGVLLIVAWAVTDRRAAEPVLPLHLFANRTFAATSAIGFVVGFAMFGSIVFLPLYLQDVHGVSPTSSGLRLLPLMGGLLLTSIGSGQLITRTGRYRMFPILGTALMTIALLLLSRITATTSTVVLSLFMFVLGVGLGFVMQVLVLAAQNSVPHEELGTATSGATFFRSIGGAFGTAVFGAIFANLLSGNLKNALHGLRLPDGGSTQSITPKFLDSLPVAVRHAFGVAYSHSIDTVFLVAVPIGAIAFLLTLLLPDVQIKGGPAAASPLEEPVPDLA